MFDEAEGTCVRPEQASEFAKKCKVPDEKRKNTSFIVYSLFSGFYSTYPAIDYGHLIL